MLTPGHPWAASGVMAVHSRAPQTYSRHVGGDGGDSHRACQPCPSSSQMWVHLSQPPCLCLCCSHPWPAHLWASSPPVGEELPHLLWAPARRSLSWRLLPSQPRGVSASPLPAPMAPTLCYHQVWGWPVVLPACPSGLGTLPGQGRICVPSTQQ